MRRIAFRLALGLAAQLAVAPAGAQGIGSWLPGGASSGSSLGTAARTQSSSALRRHTERSHTTRHRSQPAASSGASARDPSFQLANAGSRPIREAYVVAAGQEGWGADRLGARVLAPGDGAWMRLPQGQCVNDLRVVFADGEAEERRQVDTCALAELAFR